MGTEPLLACEEAKLEEEAENVTVVYLKVPFREKAIVKRLGAFWDEAERKWKVETDVALQMAGTDLQRYWLPGFSRLVPHLRAVQCKKTGPLDFAVDFCFRLQANPESTRETAGVPANVHLRVSPAELQAFIHKRCDRPQWIDADGRYLLRHMAAAREAINAHFSLPARDTDTVGLATTPQLYFWGVCVKAWVLREKPSGKAIRIVF